MKQFMILWIGQLISSIGSGMTAFAVAIYVYQLTGSATWVSVAALLAYLPTILLSPLGGILADRYDRRLMMILGDSFSALGLLSILISIQTGHGGVRPVFIGVTISSIFLALLEPAYKATVTDLLSEEDYAKASGLVQMAGASKYLLSPFIAGVILSVSDISAILLIDMATILITVVAVGFVRKRIQVMKPSTNNFNFFREFAEGMKSITRDAGVSSLVVLMFFMCFFVAFIQTLMVPMILAFTDAKTLGIMESVSAVGMLIGSVLIGVLNIRGNYARILMISLMVAGIFMAMTGTTTNSWLLVVYCMLFFTALPFVNTSADVLIRKRIPNDVQGRAWGMISVLTQTGYVVAYAVCGVLADYVFGPLLMDEGLLAGSIGQLIGTGEGRGIGLMLIITGIVMFAFAFIFGSRKSIQGMERSTYELAHH
ncbi:Major Facilitator Superfamily transporter [Desulfitobacterium dichloroeliminans LMG P-21439]|uniref:Major Facilitator Superfamily transporter n=1 Tax=Desulfitobacterium dichloroeliminans (strain LMG P-21439 / DCA1) TaxID=871963 RepID=L0F235_DESDL|nr:MFS transporter [Desulfitobacterium dichloroeliminans]AGA67914.1 Major Facilitator Superfamily transporter [Desulfitobacterium dichloroeliminans LMG P-21439]